MGSWRPERVSLLRRGMGTGVRHASHMYLSRLAAQADFSGLGAQPCLLELSFKWRNRQSACK